MPLEKNYFSTREKLMLAGLFLAKFDTEGLVRLGFSNFKEAFNVIGYALGGKPASVKNYRDEFDPIFPNPRKGWYKRPLREHCHRIEQEFASLDIESFGSLVGSLFTYDQNRASDIEPPDEQRPEESAFAKRLVTGLAAEHYFEAVFSTVPQFCGHTLQNTTRFRLRLRFPCNRVDSDEFLAVEVKGIQAKSGSIAFTPKEYLTAGKLADRYFLFVVKNFRESPSHAIYQNPLGAGLRFTKNEQVVINTTWQTAM